MFVTRSNLCKNIKLTKFNDKLLALSEFHMEHTTVALLSCSKQELILIFVAIPKFCDANTNQIQHCH
jgi:hypothetical protein